MLRRLVSACSDPCFSLYDPSVQEAIDYLHDEVENSLVSHEEVRFALKDTGISELDIEDIIRMLPKDSKSRMQG